MKGGYKIISLHGKNLTVGGAGVVIPGVYESIEENHGKATLLSDIVISEIERPDRFCYFGVDSGNYVSVIGITPDVYTLHITITSDDVVTLTEL